MKIHRSTQNKIQDQNNKIKKNNYCFQSIDEILKPDKTAFTKINFNGST